MKSIKRTLSFIDSLERELLDYHVFSNKSLDYNQISVEMRIENVIEDVKRIIINKIHHEVTVKLNNINGCTFSITKISDRNNSNAYRLEIEPNTLTLQIFKQMESGEYQEINILTI